MDQKQHFEFINHAKSIGILLMIIGHIWIVNPAIRQFIYSFHMPLFFIIAGFLYKHVPFRERAAKDWKSLLLPYLLINICCMVIRLIVPLLTEPDYPFLKHFFSQAGAVLVGESFHQFGLEPVCGPSWFILAIALLHLMRYFPLHGLLLSLLSIAGAWSLHHFQIIIPGPLDAAIMAYPFFYIGSLIRRIDWQKISYAKLILLLVLSLLLTWIMNRYNGAVDINSLNYGRNMAIYYLCSVSGTMIVLTFCILLERMEWRWLDYFADVMAAGTIVVVGFHRFILAAAEQLISMTPMQGLLFGIGVFIVFYPICILSEKKVPVFTGYRK